MIMNEIKCINCISGLSDNVFCLLSVSVIRKTCQCMKDVMDHATDKVLENALANGSESCLHTHTQTVLCVLITKYIVHKPLKSRLILTQTHSDITYVEACISLIPLHSSSMTGRQLPKQTRITSVSHHSPPPANGTNQSVVLSPLRAYLKRGILPVGSILIELECSAV